MIDFQDLEDRIASLERTVRNIGVGQETILGSLHALNKVVAAGSVETDTVDEHSDATGVTLDGVLLKDGAIILPDSGELTISSGVITVTGSRHTVDTESDDATDDLVTINGGVEGMILFLRSASSDRDPTIKNAAGNIYCGADFTLTNARDLAMLVYDDEMDIWLAIALQSNA